MAPCGTTACCAGAWGGGCGCEGGGGAWFGLGTTGLDAEGVESLMLGAGAIRRTPYPHRTHPHPHRPRHCGLRI
eukprot:3857801-Alexandrium_andersonii.AAC.1